MLELKNIVKEYKDFKLNNINLEVEKGELLAILGPSGCGKTTILRLIAGLEEEFQGEVLMNTVNIKSIGVKKRGVSMVFQEPLLFPNMNVRDNVAFGLKMRKIDKHTRYDKTSKILEEMGLGGFDRRHPAELSGGQRQRVALARALVVDPDLILMDESFSSLDYNLRQNMQELIKKIHLDKKTTIIFVTHDKDEAFYLADRVAIMRQGEIVQVGAPKYIYHNPANRYVADFLGIKNIIQGKLENSNFISDKLRLKTYYNGIKNGYLAIKAETLKLVNLGESVEGNFFRGAVEESSFKNGGYHYKIKVGDYSLIVVQNEEFYPSSAEVGVVYSPEKLIFLDN